MYLYIYIYTKIPDKGMSGNIVTPLDQGFGDTFLVQVLFGAPPAHSKCGVQPRAFGDRSTLRAWEWNVVVGVQLESDKP